MDVNLCVGVTKLDGNVSLKLILESNSLSKKSRDNRTSLLYTWTPEMALTTVDFP